MINSNLPCSPAQPSIHEAIPLEDHNRCSRWALQRCGCRASVSCNAPVCESRRVDSFLRGRVTLAVNVPRRGKTPCTAATFFTEGGERGSMEEHPAKL